MNFDPSNLRCVYRQPAASANKWAGRGANTAFAYESNGGAVSVAAWDAAWVAAGCKLIREPSGSQVSDAMNANLLALLYPVDEPDNEVVSAQDSSPAATAPSRVEAVYAAAEAWCAARRLDTPGKQLVVNLGLEQLRWGKVNYARLCKPFDAVTVDYHPCQRNVPIADYGMLIDKLAAIIGQSKIICGLIEGTNEQLAGSTYANAREPSPADFAAEVAIMQGRKMGLTLFPQRIGHDATTSLTGAVVVPKVDFAYDAVASSLLAAWAALAKPWAAPVPAVGPLDGKTLTMDGWTYYLRSK